MSSGKKTVLYFSPHQDDELLSMGIDICMSLKKKYNVHVILCSDGSKSYVHKLLANGKPCKKHEGTHQYTLSTEEFIQARDYEFIGSCLALGVSKANIHIPKNRSIDGSLSVSHAESLIRSFLDQFGYNVEVCTIAPNTGLAQHRDHKSLGRAAENLIKAGIIRKARFFIEPYHYEQVKDHPYLIPVAPKIQIASPAIEEIIKEAVNSYSLWAPDQHRYAVGYHSVTTEFQDFLQSKTCYSFTKFHPSSMTQIEKLNNQHSRWKKLKSQSLLNYSSTGCDPVQFGELTMIRIRNGDIDGFRRFCETYHMILRDKDLQRLHEGSSFWCLVSKECEVLTTGWLAYRQAFYIGETDFSFQMDQSNSAILYDFNTVPAHRGKGLYGLLLRGIVCSAEGPKQFIIYTSPDNTSSSKGILKAGFQFDGAMSAADGTLKRYLFKHGFTHIHHKNRLCGLWIAK